MLRLTDSHWREIEDTMRSYMWELFIRPIYEVAQTPLELINSRNDLIQAIREGRISYDNGEFTGDFNARISRELRKFAEFDGRSNTWKGSPPPDVLGAAVVANRKARDLAQRLGSTIDKVEAQVESAIRNLSFPIRGPMDDMNRQLVDTAASISILPKLTDEMRSAIASDYNYNQTLNIKGWAPEQITRLREMVERFALRGYRRQELRDLIEREWEVSANKARFLARQETSLFMSKLRRERYLEGGIRRYRWSTSRDERVREDHQRLHGKEFFFGDPPIVDERTGRRAEPGEDFNCRCQAIPIIDAVDRS